MMIAAACTCGTRAGTSRPTLTPTLAEGSAFVGYAFDRPAGAWTPVRLLVGDRLPNVYDAGLPGGGPHRLSCPAMQPFDRGHLRGARRGDAVQRRADQRLDPLQPRQFTYRDAADQRLRASPARRTVPNDVSGRVRCRAGGQTLRSGFSASLRAIRDQTAP